MTRHPLDEIGAKLTAAAGRPLPGAELRRRAARIAAGAGMLAAAGFLLGALGIFLTRPGEPEPAPAEILTEKIPPGLAISADEKLRRTLAAAPGIAAPRANFLAAAESIGRQIVAPVPRALAGSARAGEFRAPALGAAGPARTAAAGRLPLPSGGRTADFARRIRSAESDFQRLPVAIGDTVSARDRGLRARREAVAVVRGRAAEIVRELEVLEKTTARELALAKKTRAAAGSALAAALDRAVPSQIDRAEADYRAAGARAGSLETEQKILARIRGQADALAERIADHAKYLDDRAAEIIAGECGIERC